MHSTRLVLADSTALSSPLAMPTLIRARTTDSFMTFDQATVDSTGAFLISELERLDPKLHEPLASVSWGRDIEGQHKGAGCHGRTRGAHSDL